MHYDLEERTTKLGRDVLIFLKTCRINILNENVIRQLLRSVTSIGANYREANAASSKKDFRNKIHIARKETNETKHWLELLAEVESEHKEYLRLFWKETHELAKIFNKISTSLQHKKLEIEP